MSLFLDLPSFEHEILFHLTVTTGWLDAHEQADHNPFLSSIGQHITDKERPVLWLPLAFPGAHGDLRDGQESLHLTYGVALRAASVEDDVG